MAGSLNKVTLIGNVGADPEVRNLNSGNSVANLTLATSESWKDKSSGEKKEITQWHRIVCWNDGLIDIIEKYVKKGSKVYVEGQLQTRKWEDQDGKDRYSTEVVLTGFDAKLLLLGDPRGGGDRDQNDNANRPGNRSGGDRSEGRSEERDRGRQDQRGNFSRDIDDDIPF
jgi:single-strand DNA-binding protein